MMTVEKIISQPPRSGKTAFGKAQAELNKIIKKAYDKTYQKVFQQVKGDIGKYLSDEEIHEFIHKWIEFKMDITSPTTIDPPVINITAIWKIKNKEVKKDD